jgi:hypothetical protein
MAVRNKSESSRRFHIVLIPGFGGFDAIGKVQYYAGVTELFKTWNHPRKAVLHYFDNLPTAAVVTRASRLRTYLAKRIARGEIVDGDEVTLVGHSTGGLDIRQLISELHSYPKLDVPVDDGIPVSRGEILRHVRRVVFLSVPHWGTKIADWVNRYGVLRQLIIAGLGTAVSTSQLYRINQVEERFAGSASCITDADVFRALQDALAEANEHYGEPGPERTAEAFESASDLSLYFRHLASNFSVIEDLMTQRPDEPKSPAQFNRAERKRELAGWKEIAVLSYATVGKSPFRFAPGRPAPVWDLANPCTYPEVSKDCELSAGTDISYRACYRACAGGSFERPGVAGQVKRWLNGAPQRPLEQWDNDGIVNTLSMLWPNVNNVLVSGDHLDIVGHYRLRRVNPAGQVECLTRRQAREYWSYDTLKSSERFSDQLFGKIWREIFDFATGKKDAAGRGRAITMSD